MTDLFSTSRNAVVLSGVQLLAMAAGFITQIAVARLLLPAAYGSFGVVLSVLIWVEPLVSGGLTLALAQVVSANPAKLPAAARWVKRMFVPYSLVVWAVYSVASNRIASGLGDSQLRTLLLVAGLELPSLAVLAASREMLMGIGESGRQAATILTYTLLRASCIVALTFTARSALGALAGNALAALMAAVVAVILLRPSIPSSVERRATPSDKSLPICVLRAGVPTLFTILLTQFALSIDLWTVKRVIADPQAVGWYAAGRSFAFLPYMLATGLNLALFPALCSELARGDRIRALSLTREAVRVLIVCLLPLCAIVVPTASPLAHLLFSEQFGGAALPVRVLTIGLSCFSIIGTLQAVIIADGKPLFNSMVAGLLSIAVTLLSGALVPAYGLAGAAWAVTSTGAAGAAVLGIYVAWRLGAIVPVATMFRVAVAAACLFAGASVWQVEGPWLLGQYVAFAGLYALILLALGEITRSDLNVAWVVATRLCGSMRIPRRSFPD